MIEFKTKYDKKFIDKACKISIGQIIIPLLVIAVCFLGLSLFYFSTNHIIIGLIWFVLSIVYIPLFYFITIITQIAKYDKMYLKENKKGKLLVDTYQFDEDSVLLSTDLDDKNISKVDTDYKYFLKVVETKTDFIMYKTRTTIFVLPKECITVGTIEEFEVLLQTHFGDKFKNKCMPKEENLTTSETQTTTLEKNTEENIVEEKPVIIEETSVVNDENISTDEEKSE